MKIKFIMLFLVMAITAFGQDFPKPAGFINDFAGVITPEEKQAMEVICREVQEKTGAEIAAGTMNTIGEANLEDYVNRLYQKWGVGQKGKDNGVLIFAAIQDRQMRIETGYGLEGALPDAVCAQIRDQYMLPAFKKGEYGKGFLQAIIIIAQRIAAEANMTLNLQQPIPEPDTQNYALPQMDLQTKIFGVLAVMLFLYLLIRHPRLLLFLWLMSRNSRGGWSGGGSRGGFGGGFGGFGGGMSGGGGASGRW